MPSARELLEQSHTKHPDWTATQHAAAIGVSRQRIVQLAKYLHIKLPRQQNNDTTEPQAYTLSIRQAEIVAELEAFPNARTRDVLALFGLHGVVARNTMREIVHITGIDYRIGRPGSCNLPSSN